MSDVLRLLKGKMTKANAAQYLPLVQALAEGKTIQVKIGSIWLNSDTPDFESYKPSDYRVKPETRAAREWWVSWCNRTNRDSIPKLHDSRPEPQCAGCFIVHVREVLGEE